MQMFAHREHCKSPELNRKFHMVDPLQRAPADFRRNHLDTLLPATKGKEMGKEFSE